MRWLLALILSVSAASADAPERSPWPVARGESVSSPLPRLRPQMRIVEGSDQGQVAPLLLTTSQAPARSAVRPIARDPSIAWENFLAEHAVLNAATAAAPRLSLIPPGRPDALEAMARQQQQERREGSVCGDISIQGERVPDIQGRISGCGVDDPVRVRSVAGVALSTPATIDCPTARALREWVERGVRPAVGNTGGGVAGLRVVAHYACRTRNNQPGARISEHGKGRAIDIAGILLNDGSEISVLRDWNNGQRGAILRRVHQAACGPFGTVLGPNADRFHRDHFHFDTAQYRSGSYCR